MEITSRTPAGDAWLEAYATDLPVVWQASLTDDQTILSTLTALLSAEERDRLERFRLREDQLRFLVGRGLLRILVGSQLKIQPERVELNYGPFGKPGVILRDSKSPLHFNVSHSGKWVLLAFHPVHEVGVDVEEVRREGDWEAIAQRVFPAGEYNRWMQLNLEERLPAFFQIWSRHEAGLKALGQGFFNENNPGMDARLVYYDLVLPAGYQGAVACLR